MFNKTEGAMQSIAGRVQEAFGSVAGDTSAQIKGRARRVVGGTQYGYGQVIDLVRESAIRNSVGTVAVVAGVCFVLGAVWSKR